MFFIFILLSKKYTLSQNFEPATCSNNLLKKQNSANVEASLQDYLIIIK